MKQRHRFMTLIIFLVAAVPVFCSSAQPNILFLTVDSFRADRIGAYGYKAADTPNIDSLAARGVLFESAFSVAAWTNPSNVSLLTGIYPTAHTIERRGESVPLSLHTPLETMREAGMFVPEASYMFPMPNYTNLGFTPQPIRDMKQFLTAYQDSTFFCWYHFHGPHLPYDPPEPYRSRFFPDGIPDDEAIRAVMENVLMPRGEYTFNAQEIEIIKRLYDAEVAAQDRELGEIFRTLDSLELDERTIVVLSADHGEELFDHGWLGHASTSLNGTLHDELIHIPLIIAWPDRIPAGKRVSAPVQSVDLMPTLFELAGLDWQGPLQGYSLLPLITGNGRFRRKAIYGESSVCGYQCPDGSTPVWLNMVSTPKYKLIETVTPDGAQSYNLYDLQDDPSEKKDIAAQFPAEVTRLNTMLEAQKFASQTIRSALLSADSAGIKAAEFVVPEDKTVRVKYPRDGQMINYSDHDGEIRLEWEGSENGEYLIEYVVGEGKYRIEGNLPVRGNRQKFGGFNRVFWSAFPLYNPWRFRVMPAGHPELASTWRLISFK